MTSILLKTQFIVIVLCICTVSVHSQGGNKKKQNPAPSQSNQISHYSKNNYGPQLPPAGYPPRNYGQQSYYPPYSGARQPYPDPRYPQPATQFNTAYPYTVPQQSPNNHAIPIAYPYISPSTPHENNYQGSYPATSSPPEYTYQGSYPATSSPPENTYQGSYPATSSPPENTYQGSYSAPSSPPENIYDGPHNLQPSGRTYVSIEYTSPEVVIKDHPTVPKIKPYDDKDVDDDAKKLFEALKEKYKCDEKTVMSVLTRKPYSQRNLIARQYLKKTSIELKTKLTEKLHYKFRDVILALLNPYEIIADLLNADIRSWSTKKNNLIHIICTASEKAVEMNQIKYVYHSKYNIDLDQHVFGVTSGYFQLFLLAFIQNIRDYVVNFILDSVKSDAEQLNISTYTQNEENMVKFNNIFSYRSIYHLKEVLFQYKKIYDKEFEEHVEEKFKGQMKKAILTFVKFIKDKHKYFATRLYSTMSTILIKHKKLMYLVITRSEIDMVEIKKAFFKEYNTQLVEFIQRNTYGKYRECMVQLIEE